jgi:hypothetical protein
MKTVFNNFVLYFNFLLLGLVTAIVFRLAILGGSGSELVAGFTSLIAPAIALAGGFFYLAYPDRWRRLFARFSGGE